MGRKRDVVGQSVSRSVNILFQAVDERREMASKSNSFKILFHDIVGGAVTCGCGELLSPGHTCSLALVNKLVVSRCGYRKWERTGCSTCYRKHGHQLHVDAVYSDLDGYNRCGTCGDRLCACTCVGYLVEDGNNRCKNCGELWDSSLYM